MRTEYLGVDLTSNSRRELAVRLIAHDLQPDNFNVLADYALVVLSNSERNLHLPVRQFVLTVLGGTISDIINFVGIAHIAAVGSGQGWMRLCTALSKCSKLMLSCAGSFCCAVIVIRVCFIINCINRMLT